jgi:membrane-associated PAP2 superfamily phosphatase
MNTYTHALLRSAPFLFLPRLSWMQRQGIWLLILAVFLLLLSVTPLDIGLARLFYDPPQGTLGSAWWPEMFLHKFLWKIVDWAKYIGYAFCILGVLGQLRWLPRRSAMLAYLGTILIPYTVRFLKAHTNHYRPNEVLEFGGFEFYQSLFESLENGPGSGFISGHAAAGFLWLVWAVALRPAGRRAARIALAAGLLLGAYSV